MGLEHVQERQDGWRAGDRRLADWRLATARLELEAWVETARADDVKKEGATQTGDRFRLRQARLAVKTCRGLRAMGLRVTGQTQPETDWWTLSLSEHEMGG